MANRYFTCKTDKAPQTYHCGETVVFHIFYRDEGVTVPAAAFTWQIASDFGFKDEGKLSGETGEFTLTATLDKPGFIYVTAQAVDETGEKYPDSDEFFGGAGVEIEKIVAVTEEPEDYHAFWDICKKELYTLDPFLIESVELPQDPLYPKHAVYDVKIGCVGGIPVSGILTVPRDGKKHPARVVYQGYGVKSAWFNYNDDEIILCINAHGILNDQPQEYYDALANGRLAAYGFDAEQNKNPHTCYFKYMMIRAGQALRYMMTRPEWDGKNLIARGGSQGGVQAMHAAALVPEVTVIDIFVPWLCDTNATSIGRLPGWGVFEGNALRYFDLSVRASYTEKKTLIRAGLGDYTSPPAGIVAMYHKLRGEKQLILVQSREHLYVSPEAEDFTVEECI